MPRIVKHPDIRRAEILGQAFAIFLDRGYENTSLNDVIAEAGISKGMFYHHFASKEALLVALFELVTDQMYQVLQPIIADESLDPTARLQAMFTRSAEFRIEQARTTAAVFVAYHRPESKTLFQGINEVWMARFTPVLADVIDAGAKVGAFDTVDPVGAADMMLQLAVGTKDLIWAGMTATTSDERERAAEALRVRLEFHALAFSRVLGLPDGTFTIGPPDFPQRFFELLNPLQDDRTAKA